MVLFFCTPRKLCNLRFGGLPHKSYFWLYLLYAAKIIHPELRDH